MAIIFYIILVIFSKQVSWSWGWFILSLIFDAGSNTAIRKKIVYRYTPDPGLEGEEEETDEYE